ncbi:MAG: MFS transporter, partial [Clostridia bacterium]|nr:MFS transporter [Clostridia bacterium]
AAAIVSYIPVGLIASKIGRRKTILAGVLILGTAFFLGIFVTPTTPEIIMYPIFVLAGIGWATINVNSFPMVVELAKHGDVGKYTGYYYTASMAAQIVAPILSGILYDALGMRYVFFAFGAFFVLCAFVTMSLVRHGDSIPMQNKSRLELLDVDD